MSKKSPQSVFSVLIERTATLEDGRAEFSVSVFRLSKPENYLVAKLTTLSHEETALPFALESAADVIRRPSPSRKDVRIVEVPHG